MTSLRTIPSSKLKAVTEKLIADKLNYSVHQQTMLMSQIVQMKIELAKDSLWDYCEALSPDFYKDDRPHLMELATLLGFIYKGKLKVPEFIIDQGEKVPVTQLEIELAVGEIWKKFMMNMPPQHGKSRTLTNFSSWVFGQNNEERILLASYNDDAANDFSKYTRDIIKEEKTDPNDITDIVFSDIFPATKLKFGSATYKQWALDGQHFNYKGGGIGGSFTSKGGTILITDDPIKNAEEALNQAALQRAWDFLTGTFMSRVSAEGGEPIEILNMTRWAEKDPCGRYLEGKKLYYLGNTPFNIDGQDFYFPHLWCFGKWLLLKMEVVEPDGSMLCPAIFGRGRYEDLVDTMPDAILQANYHQKPIDIEGRLFKREELQYFTWAEYDALVKEEKIAGTIGYCDVADEGDDSLSNPMGDIIDDKVYVTNVVFTKDPVEKSSLQVAQKIHTSGCSIAYFESNNGGKTFALLVKSKLDELLEDIGEVTTCTFKWRPNWQNKETRIFMKSEYIKKHLVFLDPKEYTKSSPYGLFMQEIYDYNAEGNNLHDDAPDSIHGLAVLLESLIKKHNGKDNNKSSHVQEPNKPEKVMEKVKAALARHNAGRQVTGKTRVL